MLSLFALLLAAGDPVPVPAPVTPAPVTPPPVTAPAPPVDIPAAPAPKAEPRAEAARPPLAGGYAAMSPRAAELRPVVQVAIAQLTPRPHARARVLAAERQVVAGTNYRLLLQLRDGSRWRVVVWQRLDGGREVTEASRADS